MSSKWSTVPVSEKPKITSPAVHPVQCTFTTKLVRNCQLEVQVKVSGMGGRKAGNQATCQCHSMLCRYAEQIKRKTKPCRLLGGFSGEAGVTTIATGDEAVASDSPVGKDNPQRRAATHDAEAL